MTQQTAVEWLQVKMATSSPEEMVENINVWFSEAKKMEKEIIEKAYVDGKFSYLHEGFHITAEQYYNETFGNK